MPLAPVAVASSQQRSRSATACRPYRRRRSISGPLGQSRLATRCGEPDPAPYDRALSRWRSPPAAVYAQRRHVGACERSGRAAP